MKCIEVLRKFELSEHEEQTGRAGTEENDRNEAKDSQRT